MGKNGLEKNKVPLPEGKFGSKSGQEQATWRQEKPGKVVILQQGHEETSRSQVKEEGTL